jgi:TruD family tRNA pseudouridine synthase
LNFDARFPAAHGTALARATFKSKPQDFIVEETLAFPLRGQGEHLYLFIRKTNANTEWVSKQLARQLGVAQRDIGYAGQKDRHGVTSQWFSLPGKSITKEKLAALHIEGVEICDSQAHDRKLRKGAIKQNRFTIRLRDVDVESDLLQQRVELIMRQGVPNYFDEQLRPRASQPASGIADVSGYPETRPFPTRDVPVRGTGLDLQSYSGATCVAADVESGNAWRCVCAGRE